MPDILSTGHDQNPYSPVPIEITEQDKRSAQPWMAALLTLLTSGIVPFVGYALVMIVSAGYQHAAGVFVDENLWRRSAIYSLGWCLVPGLISAILASQLARGRSSAREILLFWGMIGIPLFITVGVSATPMNLRIFLISCGGTLFIFQSVITICFGRGFRGTEEIESDGAVSADPED